MHLLRIEIPLQKLVCHGQDHDVLRWPCVRRLRLFQLNRARIRLTGQCRQMCRTAIVRCQRAQYRTDETRDTLGGAPHVPIVGAILIAMLRGHLSGLVALCSFSSRCEFVIFGIGQNDVSIVGCWLLSYARLSLVVLVTTIVVIGP